MRTIKILAFPQPIDGHIHAVGDVVLVRDEVAAEKIRLGAAEPADGEATANPGVNVLADAIDPAIPGGDPAHDAKILGLVVEDHPGLIKLEEAAGTDNLQSAPKAARKR